MRLVPLMDDTLFEMLQPRVTVYGLKGVNPNTATIQALQSLDPGITKAIADKIVTQREKDPFTDANSFYSYVTGEGARLTVRDAKDLPLVFDTITSFRINAQGQYGNVSRSITAIVVDLNSTAAKIKSYVDKEKSQNPDPNNPNPNPTPTPTQQTKKPAQTLPKGAPRIVYWYEQ
jgi:general secretion pathway protein K